ncbi:MAG: GNAT family N-acetyltransferase [Rhodobacteraceae bacterium]|nr:GNAT family N-acetyltransferase [Paracoccaceae bacterium]
MSGAVRRKYSVRFARSAADVSRAQALRARRFRAGPEGSAFDADADAFDARALHALVEENDGGRLVCCFRLLRFADGAEIASSYSAQFYGLNGLARYPGPMLEMGRFCVEAEVADPTVLRVAWGALAHYVEAQRIGLLFGCSSFAGTEAGIYADAFALLKDRHLGPRRWLPRVKAPSVFRFARKLRLRTPDLKAAARAMPPLLRSYLAMGSWVSDHAVVDRDLGTLHVFTGLEIAAAPAARLRALRAA